MKLQVYVRSVLGRNLPAGVRPDGVNVYVQLDIYQDEILNPAGAWYGRSSECAQNVAFLPGVSGNAEIRVMSAFKGIHDVVWTETNCEVDNDFQSLDGRSRRYLINTGVFWCMLSFPITESYAPTIFSRLSRDPKFCLFKTSTLRVFRRGEKYL